MQQPTATHTRALAFSRISDRVPGLRAAQVATRGIQARGGAPTRLIDMLGVRLREQPQVGTGEVLGLRTLKTHTLGSISDADTENRPPAYGGLSLRSHHSDVSHRPERSRKDAVNSIPAAQQRGFINSIKNTASERWFQKTEPPAFFALRPCEGQEP